MSELGYLWVYVVDREAMKAAWSEPGPIKVIRRMVTISDKCPQCGRERGRPELVRFYESGQWYMSHVWKNPCGHVDLYPRVLEEARAMETKPCNS
jgi:hypothetical protein